MPAALLPRVLMAVWWLVAALTALSILHGGTVQVAGSRVSLRNPSRPFLVLAAMSLLLVHFRAAEATRLRDTLRRVTSAVPAWGAALVLATLAIGVGHRFGSDVASGADSYGYVTHAEMLAAGRLRRPESPMAATAAWPNSRRSLAPLGWLPAEAGSLTPIYPPGYPLLMAAARQIHPRAMFAIVPLAGAIVLVAVVVLARAIGRSDLGVPAALLLASSPAFLMSLVVPMSDLPATAAWTAATALAVGTHRWSAAGAGTAAGLALLVRPNLLPLSIGILVLAAARGADARQRVVRLLIVGVGLATGAALVAAFQWSYYGSPTANGYGRMSDLFAIGHGWTNVRQFTRWLVETHPIAVLAASAWGTVWTIRRPARRPSDKSDGYAPIDRLWLLPALTVACYALYLPFDHWTYLRFLLPAFPVAMIWAATGLRHIASFFGEPMPSYACALAVAWCVLAGVHESRVRGVFANAASVERFRSVSVGVAHTVPPRSVVVTREFSGSLQYYGRVDTLRWDWLDPSGLADAVRTLQSQERPVFALLDQRSEAPEFERHHPHGGTSLRLEPIHTFDGTAERIALYRITGVPPGTPAVSRP